MPLPVRIAVLFFSSATLPAIDIAIAPFSVIAVDPGITISESEYAFSGTLCELIERFDVDGFIRTRALPGGADIRAVRTATDARRTAELYGHGYVAYGRVSVGDSLIEAELSLYSFDEKAVRKRLYAKAARNDGEEAVSELARRFVEYLRRDLEPARQARQLRPDFGGLLITTGVGGWIALGEWRSIVSGVFTGVVGLRALPESPLRRGADWTSYFRFGGDVRYSFGVSHPAVVSANLHCFDFLLTAELCLEPDRHAVLSLGAGPQLRILYAYQQTLYARPSTAVYAALGFSTAASYEYWFQDEHRFALGARAVLGGEQFSPVFLHLTLELYGSIHPYRGPNATNQS
jgi:hypothetical protein